MHGHGLLMEQVLTAKKDAARGGVRKVLPGCCYVSGFSPRRIDSRR